MLTSPAERKVALAFMAHPDDAEISCAGTLIRLRDAEWEIHIACTTAGECGTATLPAHEISRIRHQEGTAAANQIGATFHCLGEPDGRLVYDRQSLQKSIDLFRQVSPTLVITMPPSDYHRDHEVTSQLGRAASFVFSAPNASTRRLSAESTVPFLYYCDGHGGNDRLGNRIAPTTHVDITNQLAQKTDMLACHHSQRDWLRDHNGIEDYLSIVPQYASRRGQEAGIAYAESFVQHLGHGYPSRDLLAELFPLEVSADAASIY